MRRDQLEHAIRTACQIIGRPEVIAVGSQAILGTFSEDRLPADATMSLEIDILPIADDNDETVRLADLIEGTAGELSPFEQLHGFSIDGVDLGTSALPEGWRDRLVKVQNEKRPHRPVHPGSPDGAWTRKTSASPSSARSGRRTRTSSRRCSLPVSSSRRSSPRGCRRWPTATARRPTLRRPG